MLTVFAAANENDKDFWNDMSRLLSRHFSLVKAFDRTLTAKQEAPTLILCDMRDFDCIQSDAVIAVYKENLSATYGISVSGQAVAIVDSSNAVLTEHVSSTKMPAITCGLFARDTITLSSMDVDSAVIGIQRSISGFDGSRADPQDIPVRFAKPIDSFALMCTAAILILSGNLKLLLKGKM